MLLFLWWVSTIISYAAILKNVNFKVGTIVSSFRGTIQVFQITSPFADIVCLLTTILTWISWPISKSKSIYCKYYCYVYYQNDSYYWWIKQSHFVRSSFKNSLWFSFISFHSWTPWTYLISCCRLEKSALNSWYATETVIAELQGLQQQYWI